MSFKEFDLTEYIHALEDFKKNQPDAIMKHWGSIETFDMFIQKIKDNEENVAKLAIQQFGSIEKYTEEMKYNMDHFSEIMERQWMNKAQEAGKQSDLLYTKLTADLTKPVGCPEVQALVRSLLLLFQKNCESATLDKPYIQVLIDAYSSDYVKKITDAKYGDGAADYIVKAFCYYVENEDKNN